MAQSQTDTETDSLTDEAVSPHTVPTSPIQGSEKEEHNELAEITIGDALGESAKLSVNLDNMESSAFQSPNKVIFVYPPVYQNSNYVCASE